MENMMNKKYSYSNKENYFWKIQKPGKHIYLETTIPKYQRKDVKRRFLIKAFFVLFRNGTIGFNKTMMGGEFDPTSTNDKWKMITQRTFDKAERKYIQIEKENPSKRIYVI